MILLEAWGGWFIPVMAGGLITGVVLLAAVDRVPIPDSKPSRVCDKAVAALLESQDLVEVVRAGILIDKLDCRVRTRLP